MKLTEQSIRARKRRAKEKEVNSSFNKVRVDYRGVKVTAYEKDGVVGKVCSKSLEFLPIESFGIRRNNDLWYLSSCSIKEGSKAVRGYRNTNYKGKMISSVKNRARRTKIPFNLSEKTLGFPKDCPVLGIPLDYSYGPRSDNKATIDRIDNSKGYTVENSIVCSWRANRLKSDASLEELNKIYSFYRNYSTDKNFIDKLKDLFRINL